MKYYLTIILLLFSLSATAQKEEKLSDKLKKDFEKVDWDLVKSLIEDASSEFYYPNIYTKYMAGDTTLTLVDYRMLYYGYSFQEPYEPLAEKPKNEEALKYQLEISNTNTQEELLTLVGKAKAAMADDPFSLRMLNLLTYTYSLLRDEYNVIVNSRRMNGVIETILSSGSGVDKKSPWSVLYKDDVVDLVTVFGGKLTMRMYITTDIEYFHLKDRIENIRGFYFDLSAILRRAKVVEKGFSGFEFNPLYNPKSKSYINKRIGNY